MAARCLFHVLGPGYRHQRPAGPGHSLKASRDEGTPQVCARPCLKAPRDEGTPQVCARPCSRSSRTVDTYLWCPFVTRRLQGTRTGVLYSVHRVASQETPSGRVEQVPVVSLRGVVPSVGVGVRLCRGDSGAGRSARPHRSAAAHRDRRRRGDGGGARSARRARAARAALERRGRCVPPASRRGPDRSSRVGVHVRARSVPRGPRAASGGARHVPRSRASLPLGTQGARGPRPRGHARRVPRGLDGPRGHRRGVAGPSGSGGPRAHRRPRGARARARRAHGAAVSGRSVARRPRLQRHPRGARSRPTASTTASATSCPWPSRSSASRSASSGACVPSGSRSIRSRPTSWPGSTSAAAVSSKRRRRTRRRSARSTRTGRRCRATAWARCTGACTTI